MKKSSQYFWYHATTGSHGSNTEMQRELCGNLSRLWQNYQDLFFKRILNSFHLTK